MTLSVIGLVSMLILWCLIYIGWDKKDSSLGRVISIIGMIITLMTLNNILK